MAQRDLRIPVSLLCCSVGAGGAVQPPPQPAPHTRCRSAAQPAPPTGPHRGNARELCVGSRRGAPAIPQSRYWGARRGGWGGCAGCRGRATPHAMAHTHTGALARVHGRRLASLCAAKNMHTRRQRKRGVIWMKQEREGGREGGRERGKERVYWLHLSVCIGASV